MLFLYPTTITSSLSHLSLFLNKSVLNNYPLKVVVIAVTGEAELLSEKLKEWVGQGFCGLTIHGVSQIFFSFLLSLYYRMTHAFLCTSLSVCITYHLVKKATLFGIWVSSIDFLSDILTSNLISVKTCLLISYSMCCSFHFQKLFSSQAHQDMYRIYSFFASLQFNRIKS